MKKKERSHESRVLWLALWAGLPGSGTALIILWSGDYTSKVRWTLTVFMVTIWLGCAFAVRTRVRIPLQTLSNLLAALREGDYSIRARGAGAEDALAEAVTEVNALGETLREQRLGALEATTLLRKVMAEIDVAVFAFDGGSRLRLVNRAGEKLLGRPSERILGLTAGEAGLAECLEDEPTHTIQAAFPGGSGRWGIRRSTFREKGLPLQLLVLSDLSVALREEERQAWRRLMRVLGHELNNSLAPIRSMAGTLQRLVSREPRRQDWKEDMVRGLDIIGTRAEALSRFMSSYTRLARLPPPKPSRMAVADWIKRVSQLETRMPVQVRSGPDITIRADSDQLEQLLINLIRNAVDASLETGGRVRVGWQTNHAFLEVWVEDEGPGISNTANLFVPFFTTKPGGSGIGLALCRQIAEGHGGSVTLENRRDVRGCEARLRLPL